MSSRQPDSSQFASTRDVQFDVVVFEPPSPQAPTSLFSMGRRTRGATRLRTTQGQGQRGRRSEHEVQRAHQIPAGRPHAVESLTPSQATTTKYVNQRPNRPDGRQRLLRWNDKLAL